MKNKRFWHSKFTPDSHPALNDDIKGCDFEIDRQRGAGTVNDSLLRACAPDIEMDDISVGAIGAAFIAGLVSLLGLIIGKEQKISEFRQAWIDELRKCLVSYLVNINLICDNIRLKRAAQAHDNAVLLLAYKSLNEASHGISLRINQSEEPARLMLDAMREFEALAANDHTLVPEKIRTVESRFIEAARSLLKFEWNRVKRGEKTFVVTRWLSMAVIAMTFVLMVGLWIHRETGQVTPPPRASSRQNIPNGP